MKSRSLRSVVPPFFALRVVLGLIVFSYCLLGIGAFVGGAFAEGLISLAYGVSLSGTPELSYLVHIIGSFFLGVGIVGAFAWSNPVKYRLLIGVVALFLCLRGVQKLVFVDLIQTVFEVSPGRSMISGVLYLVFAGLLLYLRPQNK